MATISKSWSAAAQIIGSGDGYATLSGTTPTASSDVDLETDGYEGAHVIVEVNFDATPTDNVDIKVYGSLDGSNYDDTPLFTQRIDKATDPNQISLVLRDLAAHWQRTRQRRCGPCSRVRSRESAAWAS